MSKTPIIVLISSVAMLLLSILFIGIGLFDVSEIDVEDEALFRGTSGTLQVTKDATYTVFVNDEYTCAETTVSISNEEYEYFNEECDPLFDEDGWRAIGVLWSDEDGALDVSSNHEILVIDDWVYVSEGGGAFAVGGGMCCLSVIGLIVGIVMAGRSKPTNAVYVQQPLQMDHFGQIQPAQTEQEQQPVWNFPKNP